MEKVPRLLDFEVVYKGRSLDKVSQHPFVHRAPIGDRDRDRGRGLRRGDEDRVRLLP